MKKLYLHIGYPKCASTFLQKEIFRKNKKITTVVIIKIYQKY